jgi:predicted NUDIX family NTP pyrophosphohydrolase
MSRKSKRSAGLIMYRKRPTGLEVFLVHPGGPLWAKKDDGSWTLAKGEYESDEAPLAAAQREFQEETGIIAAAPFAPLGSICQKSGKVVTAWAFQGDCNPADLISNMCEIEWPPRSGKRIEIPEIDRGAWFSLKRARLYIRAEQVPLLDALEQLLLEQH